jgi:hypothetical protein
VDGVGGVNVFSRRNDILATLTVLVSITAMWRTYLAGRALAAAAVVGEAIDAAWEGDE